MKEVPIEEVRTKLFSMRYTTHKMERLSREDTLTAYGYHDAINEMLDWVHLKIKGSCKMRTPEEILKEGNEGSDLRTVIDNLTTNQIIECMEEYAREVVNKLKHAPVVHLDELQALNDVL